jgi:N-acetylglucosaminyldiphosphoundecaprenol N-acetyl-beta-D-mannosaminyltransferase
MAKSNKTSAGCILGGLAAAAVLIGGAMAVGRWRRMPIADRRLELLDVPVDPLTMDEVLARIEEFIRSRRPHHVFTADASGIMRARAEPELLEVVRHADLVTADGAGVLLATRMKGMRLPERVSGVDLVDRVSELAARKGFRIYLLGASEMVVQATAGVLASRYPGLIIAGIHHGYFSPEDEPRVVRDIATARPDVLFAALGIPKQELFIRCHFAQLDVPVMIGVGGSFDVTSGQLKRAPAWMQQSGLEWLYRLLQQPSRLPRMAALPKFMLEAWKERK